MASAQLATPTACPFAAAASLFPNPPVSYQDAVRAIALEHLDGEDPAERTAALARSFNVDFATVQIDVDEAISNISDC